MVEASAPAVLSTQSVAAMAVMGETIRIEQSYRVMVTKYTQRCAIPGAIHRRRPGLTRLHSTCAGPWRRAGIPSRSSAIGGLAGVPKGRQTERV